LQFGRIRLFFSVHGSSGSRFRLRLTNPCHLSEGRTDTYIAWRLFPAGGGGGQRAGNRQERNNGKPLVPIFLVKHEQRRLPGRKRDEVPVRDVEHASGRCLDSKRLVRIDQRFQQGLVHGGKIGVWRRTRQRGSDSSAPINSSHRPGLSTEPPIDFLLEHLGHRIPPPPRWLVFFQKCLACVRPLAPECLKAGPAGALMAL